MKLEAMKKLAHALSIPSLRLDVDYECKDGVVFYSCRWQKKVCGALKAMRMKFSPEQANIADPSFLQKVRQEVIESFKKEDDLDAE